MRAGAGDNRFALLWLRAVFDSDLPKTTKLVLAGLVTFMDPDGSNCFPSTPAIAERCSMTKTGLLPHLHTAENRGFLRIVETDDARGKGWRKHSYEPRIPHIVVNAVDHDAVEATGGGQPSLHGGQSGGVIVVNGVDQTYPIPPISKTYPQRRGEFSELWAGWPEAYRPDARPYAERLFGKLPEPERLQAVEAAPTFLRAMQLRKKPRQPPLMIPYLKERQFVDFHGIVEIDKDGEFKFRPGSQEWEVWLDDIRHQLGDRGVQSAMGQRVIVRRQRWPDGATHRSEDHRRSAAG